MGALDLDIDHLLLDSENPRFETATTQRDVLQRILDDQEEKLYQLSLSIATEGMSPIDRLLVVRENKSSDRFIALEGNRRVAALKILTNPAVLTGLNLKSSLQRRF